ncbi:hypothetical protein BKA67DRAFT_691444 [Truncatella angustata]|uniref:Dolichol-phosphate mannosyltransferase n=1 Tax=Truncatella angustata TaxID=152316 RepID=A0A9P8ZXS3_9PEZI|nr:uncharacterized protein BKA67DRAFT_691444 [Truncatella angustata]KAH6654423.1 hypothetical protein BKA67DRAFT_691444 [Truncatella angustata]KAH8194432.1 hypothetical protein TruAng_011400 [Truncatella angustata]
MSASTSFTTTVHPFDSPTSHACAYELGLSSAKNAFVFIGGLGDGPHTVPYPRAIAKALEQHSELNFSVFEFRLTSSFNGFGFARLADDVADISALVKYLRGIGKDKVVLMGHSTGTQDIMEYTSPAYKNTPTVDAFILQAPVADRGALELDLGLEALDKSVSIAKGLSEKGRGHERMPKELIPDWFSPISAQRWYALAAPDGEDNYFAPDLSREVASSYWSRIDKPLLILQSGADEFMPPSIDVNGLIKEWKSMCRPGIVSDLSGLIPDANHRVEQPESEKWLVKTVLDFLQSIK